MNIAIITARGGSKRIHHKNIRDFCGKPIIEYSIIAALGSGVFDVVMVSTDDKNIAEIARAAGAEVPFMRSAATSNDFATTADVLLEVLNQYRMKGQTFENVCCIYPTAPFVTMEKLKRAMELLIEEEAETVLPVVAYSFPPQRSMYIKDGKMKLIHPECFNMRSQDLEPIYHDCGQFYAFKSESFLKSGKLFGDNVIPVIMNDLEVQDIDNEADWKIAEMKYQLMLQSL